MKQAAPKKMLTIKTIHYVDIKMEFIIQIRKLLIRLSHRQPVFGM